MVGFQLIWLCYKMLHTIYTIWDIKMKRTHKLFHKMINRSCKLQGCSLIYTGMVKDLDVPVLLLTLGICIMYKLVTMDYCKPCIWYVNWSMYLCQVIFMHSCINWSIHMNVSIDLDLCAWSTDWGVSWSMYLKYQLASVSPVYVQVDL